MTAKYNAHEIYEIGINIEKNGCIFYKAAAEREQDSQVKKLYKELAQWEEGHIGTFEALKAKLPNDPEKNMPFDPENQYHAYLKAIADSHIFVRNDKVADLIAQCETAEDVLRMALNFEKDSVVLYTTMKQLVPENLGLKDIGRLANEEIQHVAMLKERLDG